MDQLTEGADPTRVVQLAGFLDALKQSSDTRRALDWLSKTRASAGRAVLLDLLTARAPIDHASLDVASAGRRGRATSVEFLRKLLVDAAVLPPRDEKLSRLERTIGARLDACHLDDAAILQQYAQWRILPAVRTGTSDRRLGSSAAKYALVNFVSAEKFLTWLRDQHIDPASLSQAAVDQWVVENRGYRVALAVFLRWAGRRRLLPPVTLISQTAWPPAHLVPQEEQVARLRHCLNDSSLAARDRLAGCLLLLYGQPVSRLSALELADIDLSADPVTIRLGSTPLELPPRLAELARQTVANQRSQPPRGISRGFVQAPVWVFPGRPATKPVHPETLRRRLAACGITSLRSTRNTALLSLARDVPPVVLADLLGISRDAAIRWRELSGGTWTAYTAGRASIAKS